MELLLLAVFTLPVLFMGLALLAYASGSVRYIPNRMAGVREKRISARGSVPGGLLALNGEAGYEPEVLRGGWHFFWPFQYRIHLIPLVTIPQGGIGYVYARDGKPLPPTQSLGRVVATDLQDARAFLEAGGQRGPQRQILREGTFALNLVQFVVLTEHRLYYLPLEHGDELMFQRMAALIQERGGFSPVVLRGSDDSIGVVTVHDGAPLEPGEIIAPIVAGHHNHFQDPEAFLAAGGRRGRQLQVLVDGTWYINRLFATVEAIPKTVVDVGFVGVVVSYTGTRGDDVSGVDYKHGELVEVGQRGVWSEPLLPGKYAFNTFAGKVVMVPTTNFILKWQRDVVGAHRFDENLAEVSLITRDAFEPVLPLSVVVHIDYRKAPLVIQRFGDVKRLVEQTLDPMVAAYFKNIGQTRSLIQLIHERSEIQSQSSQQMQEKFAHYNLQLEEVLIGTPSSPQGDGAIEQILAQIRARQLADEQVETYARQEKASVRQRELKEAESRAQQQARLTESDIAVTIQANEGRAQAQRALQEAERVRTLAEAEAGRIRLIADADAERIARVGVAQALAVEEQVRAYGGPQLQLTQSVMSRFAEAIEKSGVEVVPHVVLGESQGSSAFNSLLSLLLAQTAEASASGEPRSPQARKLREELDKRLGAPAT